MNRLNRLALAIATATTSTITFAPTANAAALEEIVVTARKREEVIQEVPVAITAVSGDALEKSVATTFQEATALTPGFAVPPTSTSPLAISLSMRGSVQTDSIVTMDPSVGVYIDGIYIARSYGVTVDLLDLQDIQILKGPQGTLFGRNSTAGAMLLTSNNPEFNLLSTKLSVTAGPEVKKLQGIVNIPLMDTLALRVAMLESDQDDYITNKANATKTWDTQIGSKESTTYRAKLRWEPIDALDLLLSWDRFDSNLDGPANDQVWRAGNRIPQSKSDDTVSLSFDPHNAADTETFSFIATYTADAWELKFLASSREWRHMREIDYDGADLASISATGRHGAWGREAGDQESYELQFNTSLFNDRVDIVTGALYFKEFAQLYDYSYGLNVWQKPPATQVGGGYVENNVESVGLYSQATWHVTDVSNITAGLRYTKDKKFGDVYGSSSINRTTRLPSWDFNAHKASLTTSAGAPVQVLRPDEDWEAVNWLLSYDHKIADDIMAYAKVSTGFRSGGFNGRGVPANTPFTYDPETLTEAELGFKADLFDGTVRWNTAIFKNQTKDKQFTTIFTPPGSTASATVVQNAGEAEAKGIETEVAYAISDDWTARASYAYIDSKTTELLEDGVKVPRSDLPTTQFIPENQWTLSVNYAHEYQSFKVNGTATYSWIDEIQGDDKSLNDVISATAGTTNPLTPAQAQGYLDAVTTDAFGLLNFNVTASPLDDRYSVSLWVKNVLDERKIQNATGQISGATYQYAKATYTEPRMWGVTVSANF